MTSRRAARDLLWARVGYDPTPAQRAAHDCPARIRLIAGGERAGKSRSGAMELFGRLLEGQLYWLVGPEYDLCRPEFEYVLDACRQIDAVASVRHPASSRCELITRTGARIVTRSALEPERLAAEAPDGILGCEAAQLPESVFLRLRGRIAERRGWLWLSGTFEGSRGWYAEKFRSWQMAKPRGARAFSIPSWENRALYPGGRDDAEIADLEAIFPPDLFMERFGGVPCAPSTLVFREFDPRVHVQPQGRANGSVVELAIDPGYAGAYAVLALEQRGPDVAVIDEVYLRRRVAGDVIAACRERPWWPRVRGGVIDVAGRQHHAAPSQIEIWASLGGIRLRSHSVPLRSGIDRLRTFLRDPASGRARLTVAPDCRNLIEEFGMYRYHEASDLEPVSEIPIDRDNHAIKALIYWLFDRFGAIERAPRQSIPFRITW
ncbi:MAG: hypothetical protein OXO54_13700 [Chloroflexota bacterium]|nr:hypothetical protein [Chloroflexota bacterium]MDE2899365.1 hypothetical protein [Chloroflexota bacterium]